MHGQFKIPKYIILEDTESKQSAYLSPNILAPTSEFNFMEQLDCFIVTGTKSANTFNDPEKPSKKVFSDDSFETDDEDTLYCHHGPAPYTNPMDLSSSSLDDLPSPPYTAMHFNEDAPPPTGDNTGNDDRIDGGDNMGEDGSASVVGDPGGDPG